MQIGELGTVVTGKTPSTKKSEYWDGEIMFVTPKDIQGTKHIASTERRITTSGLQSVRGATLPAGAICVSCIGNIGYVSMTTQTCVSNQQINSIIVNAENDSDFVFYLLKSLWPFFKNYEGESTTLSILNKSQFSKIEVNVPDLQTQRRIAAILSSIDDLIENNSRINDNLEQQASALMARYMESTNRTVLFSDIMSFDNGFSFRSSTYLPSGKYRIVTIKNVQDGYIDSTSTVFIDNLPPKMKSSCILHIGDVLLSLTGNVGRVGIVCETGLLLNQRVAKIVPNDKALLPFLYFVYRQPSIKIQLESIARGTAQLNLSPVETLKLQVPYERTSAKSLSKTLTPLYQAIISNSQENFSLALLRDTLLPKLLSGELDVSAIQV